MGSKWGKGYWKNITRVTVDAALFFGLKCVDKLGNLGWWHLLHFQTLLHHFLLVAMSMKSSISYSRKWERMENKGERTRRGVHQNDIYVSFCLNYQTEIHLSIIK